MSIVGGGPRLPETRQRCNGKVEDVLHEEAHVAHGAAQIHSGAVGGTDGFAGVLSDGKDQGKDLADARVDAPHSLGASLGSTDTPRRAEESVQDHAHLDQEPNVLQQGLFRARLPIARTRSIEGGQADDADQDQLGHLDERVRHDHGNAANVKGTAPIDRSARELRDGKHIADKLAQADHDLEELTEQLVDVPDKVPVVEVDELRTVEGQRADRIDDDLWEEHSETTLT